MAKRGHSGADSAGAVGSRVGETVVQVPLRAPAIP